MEDKKTKGKECIMVDKDKYIKTKIWTIALSVAVIVLLIVSACLRIKSGNTDTNKILYDDNGQVVVNRSEFNNINYDGSFVVKKSEDGTFKVDKEFSENKDLTIRQFEWYLDLLCPDCKRAYDGTIDYVKEAVNNGDIEIKYHFLNFLPHATESNQYSLSLASWIVGIAEESPENLFKALEIVEDEEFVKSTVSKSDVSQVVYDKFVELKLADKKVLDSIYYNIEKYEDAVNRDSVGIRKFKKWKDLSPDEEGRFFVPFIYNINNGTKALIGEAEDVEKEILQPLQGYVPCEVECD